MPPRLLHFRIRLFLPPGQRAGRVQRLRDPYARGAHSRGELSVEADIVSGMPDSALVAARGYSQVSGIPYVEALERNRYVGRTFIQPNQKMREKQRQRQDEPLARQHPGQTAGPHRRFHRAGDYLQAQSCACSKTRARRKCICAYAPPSSNTPAISASTCSRTASSSAPTRRRRRSAAISAPIPSNTSRSNSSSRAGAGARTGFCLGCFNGEYPYSLEGYKPSKFKFE